MRHDIVEKFISIRQPLHGNIANRAQIWVFVWIVFVGDHFAWVPFVAPQFSISILANFDEFEVVAPMADVWIAKFFSELGFGVTRILGFETGKMEGSQTADAIQIGIF